jgi:hypothetical protein
MLSFTGLSWNNKFDDYLRLGFFCDLLSCDFLVFALAEPDEVLDLPTFFAPGTGLVGDLGGWPAFEVGF